MSSGSSIWELLKILGMGIIPEKPFPDMVEIEYAILQARISIRKARRAIDQPFKDYEREMRAILKKDPNPELEAAFRAYLTDRAKTR